MGINIRTIAGGIPEWGNESGYVLYYRTLDGLKHNKTKMIKGRRLADASIDDLIRDIRAEECTYGKSLNIYTEDGFCLTNDPWFNRLNLRERYIESGSILFIVVCPDREISFRNEDKLRYRRSGDDVIKVKVYKYGTYDIYLDLSTATIQDLKGHISTISPIETSCQKLSISGTDETPLADVLENGETVFVGIGSEFGEVYTSKSQNFKADVQPIVTQSETGLANFYSTLYVVSGHVEDYTYTSVEGILGYIRKLCGFPPLISSLAPLFYGQSITHADKVAIVEGLYYLFRELLQNPHGVNIPNVKDENVFEYSLQCWTKILNEARAGDGNLEKYTYMDVTCRVSDKRLVEPVRIKQIQGGLFEKSVVMERIREKEPINGIVAMDEDVVPAYDLERILLCLPYSATSCFKWKVSNDYWQNTCGVTIPQSGNPFQDKYMKIYPPLMLRKPDVRVIIPCLTVGRGERICKPIPREGPEDKGNEGLHVKVVKTLFGISSEDKSRVNVEEKERIEQFDHVIVCTGVVKERGPIKVHTYNPLTDKEVIIDPEKHLSRAGSTCVDLCMEDT